MPEIKDKLVTAESLKNAFDELNNKSYEKLDVTYNKSNNTLVFQNSPELQKKVYVDKTLTKSNNAADAKVTGDAIAELKNENTELRGDIVDIRDTVIYEEKSVNVLNPSECATGYINNSGNIVEQSGYGHSGKIKVSSGQKLRVTYFENVASQRGVFFNDNDEKVSSVTSISDLQTFSDAPFPYWECTVPVGADYVIVNVRYGYIRVNVMVVLDNAFPTEYVPYVEPIKYLSDNLIVPTDGTLTDENKPANAKAVGDMFANLPNAFYPKLFGKNIMFCGDSITYGAKADIDEETNERKNFGYYIKKATGCNALFNAISGSTMMNVSGKNPFSVNRYQELGENLDYIILAFSTNDSASDDSLIGQYGDTTNGTFYGAWKVVIDYLQTQYPSAKIGIIGFWRGNQKYQWTDALRDIAHKYRIPMLDFMFDEKVPIVGGTDFRSYNPNAPFTVDYNTLDRRSKYFLADTVHPNDAGYQYLAPIIQNYIESL